MVYTIIYKQDQKLSTFTFNTTHDKNHAWRDYVDNYAQQGQEPIAMYPGNNIIYFERDINETSQG